MREEIGEGPHTSVCNISRGLQVVLEKNTKESLELLPSAQLEQKDFTLLLRTEIHDLEVSLFKILIEGWPNL